jgi:4-amino-4-deoxy-L-arabinose transferase-like glycosyltransferase
VTLIALAACIILAYVSHHSVAAPFTFVRTDGTWMTALNLVNGKGCSACIEAYFPFCGPTNQQTAMRGPIPVLMMAAAILVSPVPLSGFAVQNLLYLSTLVIIYILLKGYDRRAALLAALLWATSVPVISRLGGDSGGIACAFFLSVGILFFQKGRENGQNRYWIFSGLFLGFASLSRSVCMVIPVGLVLGLLWERRRRLEHSQLEQVGPALIVLGMFCLVIAPWIIRNDIVFGTPVIGSTLVGYNVFRYNYILHTNNFVPHYVGIEEAKSALMNLIR